MDWFTAITTNASFIPGCIGCLASGAQVLYYLKIAIETGDAYKFALLLNAFSTFVLPLAKPHSQALGIRFKILIAKGYSPGALIVFFCNVVPEFRASG